MRLAVDVVGFVLGIDNLLAVIEPIVAGEHVAESDGKQEVGHALIAEQFKADKQ